MQPIALESPFIRLVVRPDLGGRMTSLVDRRSGQEWLWENPYLAPRPVVYGESYTEQLDGGGWDEILPRSPAPINTSAASVRMPASGRAMCLTSWKAGLMKTTIDLPEDLVREMKFRAVREGSKLREVAEEVFRRGLAAPATQGRPGGRQRVKLPIIPSPPGAKPFDLSGKRLLELEMEAEQTYPAP